MKVDSPKPAWAIAYLLLESLLEIDDGDADGNAEETSLHYLKWMCNEIINNRENWPIDKAHRWIGYIQGVMCTTGRSTVEEERERVRKVIRLTL